MSVQGVIASSGDTTILAASTKAYRLREFTLQLEGSEATTVLIKFGANTWRRFYMSSQGFIFSAIYDTPIEIPPNQALVLNLSGSNSVSYFFDYIQ